MALACAGFRWAVKPCVNCQPTQKAKLQLQVSNQIVILVCVQGELPAVDNNCDFGGQAMAGPTVSFPDGRHMLHTHNMMIHTGMMLRTSCGKPSC